ncbi:metallophosphoesterase [Enterococcus sp. AZ072]|uniref:metallophosphoesterase n=1 Tax=unclassified Enterococcus TaxID=2608891 RepID=UPI003D2899C2
MQIILLSIVIFVLYASYETFRLKEKHFSLKKENHIKIEEGHTGSFTIAHISDIHFSRFYSPKRFSKIVAAINLQVPEVIIFTGDLVEDFRYWRKRDCSEIIRQLAALQAVKGKFAILGNHDYQSEGQQQVQDILVKGGFTLLDNQTQVIETISLSGIEDNQGGIPDYSITPLPADFSILLIHEPDQVDEIKALSSFDLVLAGHSHGGQLHLPGLPYRNHGSKKYWAGIYHLSEHSLLIVNTGLGTTGPPLRFRVIPEILYLHL